MDKFVINLNYKSSSVKRLKTITKMRINKDKYFVRQMMMN